MNGRDKIYSEQEATDIVLEAAKIQEMEPEEGQTYVPGIRLDELKRMAKELGVEEQYLMKALERRGGSSFKPVQTSRNVEGFWATPWKKEFEAVVDGELPPEHFDIVVEELSGAAGAGDGSVGLATTVGRMVQGTVADGWGHGRLQVAGRHGRTRVKLSSDSTVPVLTGIFPFSMIGLLTWLIGVEKGGWPTLVGFGICAALTLAGFMISKGALRAAHRSMEDLFNRVVEKVDKENSILRENLAESSAGVSEEVGDELSARVGED